jgi:hypothetical protein
LNYRRRLGAEDLVKRARKNRVTLGFSRSVRKPIRAAAKRHQCPVCRAGGPFLLRIVLSRDEVFDAEVDQLRRAEPLDALKSRMDWEMITPIPTRQ